MIDLPWPWLDNLPGPSGRRHQSIFTSEDPPLRWRERRLTGGIRRGPETLRLSLGRRAVRIKRRLVLTYAEVLLMVGYHGPLDLPAGI